MGAGEYSERLEMIAPQQRKYLTAPKKEKIKMWTKRYWNRAKNALNRRRRGK